MIPAPTDPFTPAATVDCLAATGVDSMLPLILGLVVIAFGVMFFVLSRGRLRKSGVTLGLMLLLAGGIGTTALAPATSASADSCTPLDYAVGAFVSSPRTNVFDGELAVIAFDVVDVVDRVGTAPIEVVIPKLATLNGTLLYGPDWTFDNSDPVNYRFTYAGALNPGQPSDFVVFQFQLNTGSSSPVTLNIPVSIVTGSAGDTVVSNNTVTVSILVQVGAG